MSWCPPNCTMACLLNRWAPILFAERSGAPPGVRLGWAILGNYHGVLPADEWSDAIAACLEHYGLSAVIEGLRFAATMPLHEGWTARHRRRAEALLSRYLRLVEEAA